MTDHLPECQPIDPDDGPLICICEELRACEQRIANNIYMRGFSAGLDAAEAAVANVAAPGRLIEEWSAAISAIRALKEKP